MAETRAQRVVIAAGVAVCTLLVAGAGGCIRLDGLASYNDGGSPSNSPDGDADGGAEAGPQSDSGVPDSGNTAAPIKCASGAPVAPVKAFDATPPAVNATGPAGVSCNWNSALVLGGPAAGLGRPNNSYGTIDGKEVTGCIGVDFGSALPLRSIVIRAAGSQSQCDAACNGASCGTGDGVYVFRGEVSGQYTFVASQILTSELAVTPFPIPASPPTRYATVCRQADDALRDQIAVDAISGMCQ